MKTLLRISCLAFISACALSSVFAAPDAAPAEKATSAAAPPKIEVVFALDTTGSMGGMIQAAKDKIWSIANMLASAKPTPQIKMGLVAYRDRGDVYITKITPLSANLDAVYKDLQSFQAAGGGDTPESVNQALNDAVTKIDWSKDAQTYRVIFLVGDAEPHMDYPDDVKYPVTCKLASQKGININCILCGNSEIAWKYWQDIATLDREYPVKFSMKAAPCKPRTRRMILRCLRCRWIWMARRSITAPRRSARPVRSNARPRRKSIPPPAKPRWPTVPPCSVPPARPLPTPATATW